MADATKVVVCSHCAERLNIAADFTGTRFKCVKCGELTTIQLGSELADNTKAQSAGGRLSATSKWSDFFKSSNGKIAAAAALAVVLLIGAIMLFSGHSESYDLGHKDAQGGIPPAVHATPSEMCSDTLQMELTEHSDVNANEYMQGCLDGYAEQGRR